MISQIIGGIYQILEKLGEGGMGTVFKATDLNLQRPVAIKVLRADFANNPALAERFRSEAITLAKLNHPNITTLYNFLSQDGQYFMIMEYVAGETLEHIIRRQGAMPIVEAVLLFCQALEGIGQAHRMGIVHRDIKPANLMVVNELEERKVKVMDFGIARILGTNHLTRPGGMVGTLHYMSPEQARARETDNRSDIYSLGVVLYEMLTGKVPFDANSEYDLIDLHVKQTPTFPRILNPAIPEEIEGAILKAMAKQPSDRFQTVSEFRAFLLTQIGVPVGSNIQSSPLLKETRLESQNKPPVIPETKVETGSDTNNIPKTKIETNPNLGVIPGTRVETNAGLRDVSSTNPEIPLINDQSQASQNLNDQRQVPPTVIVTQDSFLKRHGLKLVIGVVVLFITVSGGSIAFFVIKNRTGNAVSTPTPVNSVSPVPTPISTPTASSPSPSPSPSPKVELVDPTPTPDISNGENPNGNKDENSNGGKPVSTPSIKPTPMETVKPTNVDKPPIKRTPKPLETKPLEIKPTPKPIDPEERDNRRRALMIKLRNLMLETRNVDVNDIEKRQRLERERQEIERELDKLK